MRCTRCGQKAKLYDVTPLPRFDWKGSGNPLDQTVTVMFDFDMSCEDCLTPSELAKLNMPVALFVIEQMLQNIYADGRTGGDHPLVRSLHHVRTKLLYETGPRLHLREQVRLAREKLCSGMWNNKPSPLWGRGLAGVLPLQDELNRAGMLAETEE